MNKKQIGWPFQEGYGSDGTQEIHLFTDYRWNDGSFSRLWHVDPNHYEAGLAALRPVSLKGTDDPDQ